MVGRGRACANVLRLPCVRAAGRVELAVPCVPLAPAARPTSATEESRGAMRQLGSRGDPRGPAAAGAAAVKPALPLAPQPQAGCGRQVWCRHCRSGSTSSSVPFAVTGTFPGRSR
jgi:hypothetical protein